MKRHTKKYEGSSLPPVDILEALVSKDSFDSVSVVRIGYVFANGYGAVSDVGDCNGS